jgi:putative ABC transport system ATP-binding protein
MPIEDGVILRTEGLSRAVQGELLLDGINVAVRRGEVLAVIGPSGSGKSTFLRLLNRLDEPTSGTVFLDSRDYREIAPPELRRRVGLVMQTPFLFPGTVGDNLRFGPRQRRRQESPDVVDDWLERVGLPGFAGRGVGSLSGGEAQRVSLARTLANDPQVLLLDEPTSALDESSRGEIEKLILTILRDEGLTCVMVTHDTGQAMRMADRAMLLRRGRTVEVGAVQEVVRARADLH